MERIQGSAGLILQLKDSKITMTHPDGTILRSWNAQSGDWSRMFDRICETFSDNQTIFDWEKWYASSKNKECA